MNMKGWFENVISFPEYFFSMFLPWNVFKTKILSYYEGGEKMAYAYTMAKHIGAMRGESDFNLFYDVGCKVNHDI